MQSHCESNPETFYQICQFNGHCTVFFLLNVLTINMPTEHYTITTISIHAIAILMNQEKKKSNASRTAENFHGLN